MNIQWADLLYMLFNDNNDFFLTNRYNKDLKYNKKPFEVIFVDSSYLMAIDLGLDLQ